MPDATPDEIKKAYYSCMKACHPDLSGDDPDVTNFCMFINEVYSVRSNSLVLHLFMLRWSSFLFALKFVIRLSQHACARAGSERSSTTCSVWWDPWVHCNSNQPFLWWQCTEGSCVRWWIYLHWYIDSSLVDRSYFWVMWSMIHLSLWMLTTAGCKNCANICPKVFQIEEDFGRSRVYSQSGSTELIQDAIDSWLDLIPQIYLVVRSCSYPQLTETVLQVIQISEQIS